MEQQSVSPIVAAGDQAASFRNSDGYNLFNRQHSNRYLSMSDVLEPEFVLPVQFNDMVRRRVIRDGESRLLLAVLKDALRCYLKNMNAPSAHAYRLFEETAHWFYAGHQEGIFAYEPLCDALGIDPEPLRQWLKSLHFESSGGGVRDEVPGDRRRARDFMKSRMVLA
jgi:hypothetical protein